MNSTGTQDEWVTTAYNNAKATKRRVYIRENLITTIVAERMEIVS